MWIPCCDYILADGTISSRKCLKRENILPLRVPLETRKALLENVKFKWKIFCQKIKSKAVLENVKGQSESALIRNFWHQFTACEATHWLIIACASQSLLLFFLIYWSCVKCALPFIPLVPEVAVIRSGNCWRLRGSRLLPPRIIIFLFLPFFFLFKIVKICFFYFLYFLNRKTGRDWRTNIRCSTIHNCLLLARAAPHFRDENSLQRFLLFQ